MQDAAELRKRAQVAARAGDFPAARRLLDRARGLAADDPEMTALIGASSAYVDAEQFGADTGREACQALLRNRSLSDATRGTIWSQLGLLNMRAGDRVQALRAYSQAIPLLDREPETLGRAHLNRANVHLYMHDPRAAIADLTIAQAKLSLVDNREDLARVEHNLGYAQLLLGDLLAALDWMDRALMTVTPVPLVLQSVFAQDRAEVLLAAGRVNDAISTLEIAASAYGAQRLRRFQAEAEYVLARTLLHAEPARAGSVARRAARRFRAHDSPVWATRADALAVISAIIGGARGAALAERADALVAELRKNGHHHDSDVLALHAARLALRRRDPVDANDRLRRVRVGPDTPVATRLLHREVRAELARSRGERARAFTHVRSGLDDLHTWQSSFGSLDLQSSVVGHGNHLARLGLQLAFSDGDPATVFEWSERARALASRVTSLRPPPDPALAAALTELRMIDQSDTAAVRALKERIRSGSWFSATGTVDEPVHLRDFQKRLSLDGSALVAHIVVDDTITALAVTADSAVVIPLGAAMPVRGLLDRVAADLDFAAQNRQGDFAGAVRASLRDDLTKLAAALVDPVLDTIADRRLVLTPSALLAGTPWTCLPGLVGRPLTIPTSATRWLEQTHRPIVPPRIAGFVAGPRLQRAEDEVQRASAAWPTAQVLLGAEADAARVGWLASRVDLFHVAGHGQHPGDHPLFSAIELADGPWFGHDVDLLPRTPDLVVLSACDLGRATVLHGEESVGMSAAWLHAGARTVVSSPALLADDLACEVFGAWHELVAAGTPPADALARVVAATDEIVPLLTFGAGW